MKTLEALAESIKLIKPERQDVCLATSASGSYLFANDLHRQNQKTYLDFHRKLPKDYTSNSIGIIVGNGNIISLLPEINAQTILLCDIDPKLFTFLNFIRNYLITNNEKVSEDFFDSFVFAFKVGLYNFAKKELHQIISKKRLGVGEDKLENEMTFCGDMHYLASLARFKECCIALKNKKIIFVEIDLFDSKSVEMLGNNTRDIGYEITYMNLSNVPDYDVRGIILHSFPSFKYSENFRGVITSLNNQKFGFDQPLTGYLYAMAQLFKFISETSPKSKLYQQTKQIEYISTPILDAFYQLNALKTLDDRVLAFNTNISRLIYEYADLERVKPEKLLLENTQRTFTPAFLEMGFEIAPESNIYKPEQENMHTKKDYEPVVLHYSCYM